MFKTSSLLSSENNINYVVMYNACFKNSNDFLYFYDTDQLYRTQKCNTVNI